MKLKELFDKNGYLKFDPYRLDKCNKNQVRQYAFLFDEDGYLNFGMDTEIAQLIEESGWGCYCDAVALWHANIMAGNTKGSYPTIYYFR